MEGFLSFVQSQPVQRHRCVARLPARALQGVFQSLYES